MQKWKVFWTECKATHTLFFGEIDSDITTERSFSEKQQQKSGIILQNSSKFYKDGIPQKKRLEIKNIELSLLQPRIVHSTSGDLPSIE